MTEIGKGSFDMMGEFESSGETPFDLAANHSEADIRDMAAVLDEEIAALDDVIDAATRERASKRGRLSIAQQALSLAAEKGLE